uniref:Uncharacterized protein n=1 Tax=Plectus sambesii TaxID=2011161 RepID=A0A914WXQ5_9BILA
MRAYLIMRATPAPTCAQPLFLLLFVWHSVNKLVDAAATRTTNAPSALAQYGSPAPSSDLIAATPCVYPLPSNSVRCSIDEAHLRRYNVCDPHRAVSMTELSVISKKLDHLYLQKDDTCLCRQETPNNEPCWYKFGFAFLKRLIPADAGLSDDYSSQYCPINRTNMARPTEAPIYRSRKMLEHYGYQFARVVRERWAMGQCNEDILFLIVMERPKQLVKNKANGQQPYIFVSVGSLVQERTDHIVTRETKTLEQLVNALNDKLEHGYTLNAVYERLLDQYAEMLTLADQTWYKPKNRSHVPDWAFMVFAGCAALLGLMALGLCLMKTGVRRGSQRGKSGTDTQRRWKAGFVGVLLGGLRGKGQGGDSHEHQRL